MQLILHILLCITLLLFANEEKPTNMPIHIEKYKQIFIDLNGKATLIAVSKTKPIEDIQALYDLGQRDFGENKVQEMVSDEMHSANACYTHTIGGALPFFSSCCALP